MNPLPLYPWEVTVTVTPSPGLLDGTVALKLICPSLMGVEEKGLIVESDRLTVGLVPKNFPLIVPVVVWPAGQTDGFIEVITGVPSAVVPPDYGAGANVGQVGVPVEQI